MFRIQTGLLIENLGIFLLEDGMKLRLIIFFMGILILGTEPEEKAIAAGKGLMKALGTALKEKIQTEGQVAAIDFCHQQAIPITQGQSQESGYQVSRVTDRPRNPINRADEKELKLIALAQQDLRNGELKAVYKSEETVYLPLVVQPLCLNCHGTQVSEPVLQVISQKYPTDQAMGYSLGDFRGFIKVKK